MLDVCVLDDLNIVLNASNISFPPIFMPSFSITIQGHENHTIQLTILGCCLPVHDSEFPMNIKWEGIRYISI